MKYSVLVALFVSCVFVSGCATQQTFTFTAPEGPFCVLDGADMHGGGNMDEEESWFRLANTFMVQLHRFPEGYQVVDIEKDSGIHQDDLEGKSFRRTVVMTARPTSTRVFRTKDGRGIVLVQETSGLLGYETTAAETMAREVVRVLSMNNEETVEDRLADLPDDNVFIIMIANGEREGEVIVRKNRRNSQRQFLGITTSLNSILTLVGVLDLYIPTEDKMPPVYAEEKEEAMQREAEEIIRELDEKYGNEQAKEE